MGQTDLVRVSNELAKALQERGYDVSDQTGLTGLLSAAVEALTESGL